jgi:hypothetical protein
MALLEQFKNFATTQTTNVLAPGDTSIIVANGSVFPTLTVGQYFYMNLADSINPLSPPTKREIVKVTARSGNTLTVVRGQDGTTALSWDASTYAELRVVAATFTDIHDQILLDVPTSVNALTSLTDIT